MTFTEAALEVLRSAGEPLHYKKITELAIARNLLSHVGKTPEVTMSSRLATLVKKDRGQSGIVKVRPGVFAVRESPMQSDNETTPLAQPSAEEEGQSITPVHTPRPPIPGADVFPEEEGDDDPILAGIEETGGEDRGRRRRRRRRRGKGGEGDEPVAAEPRAASRSEEAAGPRGPGRGDRDRDRDRDRHGRDRDRDRDRGRDRRVREERVELDLSRQPGDGDLLGKDLADAVYSVLARGDRSPASFARIAELLVRRGRLSGSPEALSPTVAAALRADAARAQHSHARPRFRVVDQRVSLTEWLLPRDVMRSEENLEQAAEQQRDQVRRAFVNRLNDLPTAGFAEAIATWLNAEGVIGLRAVRRPGSSGRELHLAGTLRRGTEETRLAVVVMRSGRDLDRDTVVEVRGSVQHYGGAAAAWLVTTSRVTQAARDEAGSEHATPCALLGGADLARSMERLGIGLRQYFVPLCDIDFDLLEALGDAGLRRDRNGRDEQRPRREDSGRPERGPARRDKAETGTEAEAEGETEARSFDLLDPEAAEASRLPPEARDFKEREPEARGTAARTRGARGPKRAPVEDEEELAAAAADDDDEGTGERAAAAAGEDENGEIDFDRDRDHDTPFYELDDDSDNGDDDEPEANGDDEPEANGDDEPETNGNDEDDD